jgi:hypothetical protein
LWDAGACADADVSQVADTSDGLCNPAGQPCNTAAGGAGNNALGDIDTVRGNGTCDANGVQMQIDVPVHLVMWYDNDANPGDCPDEDGAFDPGDDLPTYVDTNTILSLTTASSSAAFADKNMDGCKRAGNGPDGPYIEMGSPASGPCCIVGDGVTLVSTNAVVDPGYPMFDRLISLTMPATVNGCGPSGPPSSCTVTTDVCRD